jgi:hypothetical protein
MPRIVSSALIDATRRLKFQVAVRPGLMSPTVSARMAATLDQISGGRCLVNIVVGGDPVELGTDGLFPDHDTRYELADEFLFGGAFLKESASTLPVNTSMVNTPYRSGPVTHRSAPSASGYLLWRLIGSWTIDSCTARGCLSHLGRASSTSR